MEWEFREGLRGRVGREQMGVRQGEKERRRETESLAWKVVRDRVGWELDKETKQAR